MKTDSVKQKIGDSLVLETRYPLYFGVAVYRDLTTNQQYVLLLRDVHVVLNKQQFLNIARQIS